MSKRPKHLRRLWKRSSTFTKVLTAFVTLAMVLEMFPAQSVAYARQVVLEATGFEPTAITLQEAEPAVSEEQELAAQKEAAVPEEQEAAAEEEPVVSEDETQVELAPEPEATEQEEGAVDETETEPAVEPEEGAAEETEGEEAVEPAAEEEAQSEEAPDEADKKAETVKLEQAAGDVTVTVEDVNGILPEGVELRVADASAYENVVAAAESIPAEEGYKAVDIALVKDGEPVTLRQNVKVTISGYDASGAGLYHIVGDKAEVVSNAVCTAAGVTFEAQSFSPYLIAKTQESDSSARKKAVEPTREADSEANEEKADLITVTFDPTAPGEQQLEPITIQVAEGEAIGDQLPDLPEIPGYNPKWVIDGTSVEVTAGTKVTEPFKAVVDRGEKIIYTVTFLKEDGTTLKTVDVDIDSGFAVKNEDYPAVPEKTNQVGKWVLQGTETEFPVGTVVSADTTVVPSYTQNIFTVTFMVDGEFYEEMTTATGTTIVLPTEPTKAGATFSGWFTEPDGQGTQYTAESTVSEDLTLYAYFADQVRVSFIVKDAEGNIITEKSQYFIDLEAGDKITTFPDDPFVEGEVFDHWAVEGSDPEVVVDENYTVTESINAVAVFKDIATYEFTVNYYYINGNDDRIEIGTQVYDLIEDDFPYTVTAPGFTSTDEHTDDDVYYPSQPTITVTKDQFTKAEGSNKYTYAVEDEYVAADASYKVGHYLEALSGDGYELIETVDKVGVKNSKVTPDINSYSYADFANRDEDITLTGDASQELKVYYSRRNFTLSYNVGGGVYIEAVTEPYGTEITLPTTATRTGYTFDGWYTDSECTQSAGTSITLEDNTTLYAKWNAAQVDYKIVYMTENANDNDYSYLATVTKQAETGSVITMTAQTAGATGTRHRNAPERPRHY